MSVISRLIDQVANNDSDILAITTLSCLGFPLTDDEVSRLSNALKKNTTVSSVEIQSISNKSVHHLFSALLENQNIRKLHLRFSNIRNDSAQVLCKALKQNYSITQLFLRNCNIGNIEMIALSQGIKFNTTIQSINLSANKISDLGVYFFTDAIINNNTLKEIDFSNNPIGDLGISSLGNVIENNEDISIRPLSLIYKACKESKETTELFLNQVKIGKVEARYIVNQLKGTDSLSAIILRECGIRDEEMSLLVELFKSNPSISVIDLPINAIGDYGISLLTNLENRNVGWIGFSANKLGDEGALSIAKLLKTNKSIAYIVLNGNIFTNQIYSYFIDALDVNHTLQNVVFFPEPSDSCHPEAKAENKKTLINKLKRNQKLHKEAFKFAKLGNLASLCECLDKGAPINFPLKNKFLLQVCLEKKHSHLVKELVKRGVHLYLCESFINYKTSPNITESLKTYEFLFPREYPFTKGLIESLQKILQHKIDTPLLQLSFMRNDRFLEAIEPIIEEPSTLSFDLNALDNYKFYPSLLLGFLQQKIDRLKGKVSQTSALDGPITEALQLWGDLTTGTTNRQFLAPVTYTPQPQILPIQPPPTRKAIQYTWLCPFPTKEIISVLQGAKKIKLDELILQMSSPETTPKEKGWLAYCFEELGADRITKNYVPDIAKDYINNELLAELTMNAFSGVNFNTLSELHASKKTLLPYLHSLLEVEDKISLFLQLLYDPEFGNFINKYQEEWDYLNLLSNNLMLGESKDILPPCRKVLQNVQKELTKIKPPINNLTELSQALISRNDLSETFKNSAIELLHLTPKLMTVIKKIAEPTLVPLPDILHHTLQPLLEQANQITLEGKDPLLSNGYLSMKLFINPTVQTKKLLFLVHSKESAALAKGEWHSLQFVPKRNPDCKDLHIGGSFERISFSNFSFARSTFTNFSFANGFFENCSFKDVIFNGTLDLTGVKMDSTSLRSFYAAFKNSDCAPQGQITVVNTKLYEKELLEIEKRHKEIVDYKEIPWIRLISNLSNKEKNYIPIPLEKDLIPERKSELLIPSSQNAPPPESKEKFSRSSVISKSISSLSSGVANVASGLINSFSSNRPTSSLVSQSLVNELEKRIEELKKEQESLAELKITVPQLGNQVQTHHQLHLEAFEMLSEKINTAQEALSLVKSSVGYFDDYFSNKQRIMEEQGYLQNHPDLAVRKFYESLYTYLSHNFNTITSAGLEGFKLYQPDLGATTSWALSTGRDYEGTVQRLEHAAEVGLFGTSKILKCKGLLKKVCNGLPFIGGTVKLFVSAALDPIDLTVDYGLKKSDEKHLQSFTSTVGLHSPKKLEKLAEEIARNITFAYEEPLTKVVDFNGVEDLVKSCSNRIIAAFFNVQHSSLGEVDLFSKILYALRHFSGAHNTIGDIPNPLDLTILNKGIATKAEITEKITEQDLFQLCGMRAETLEGPFWEYHTEKSDLLGFMKLTPDQFELFVQGKDETQIQLNDGTTSETTSGSSKVTAPSLENRQIEPIHSPNNELFKLFKEMQSKMEKLEKENTDLRDRVEKLEKGQKLPSSVRSCCAHKTPSSSTLTPEKKGANKKN